jgi:predicted PurR-regulated permease PerM
VTAVTLTVLIAFLAMLGFVAIVLQEISSLAKQLPEYRSNFEDLRQFYVIVTDAVGVFARPIAPFISIYSTIYKDKGLPTTSLYDEMFSLFRAPISSCARTRGTKTAGRPLR